MCLYRDFVPHTTGSYFAVWFVLNIFKRVSFSQSLMSSIRRDKKLQHPWALTWIFVNRIIGLPLYFAVVLISAFLDLPLVALFTLPIFLLGPPEPYCSYLSVR